MARARGRRAEQRLRRNRRARGSARRRARRAGRRARAADGRDRAARKRQRGPAKPSRRRPPPPKPRRSAGWPMQRALDRGRRGVRGGARGAGRGGGAGRGAGRAARAELARECGEKFECPPPLLAERFGFDAAALQPAEAERAELERLTAERERIGPVNLVAESELAELEQSRAAGRRRARRIAGGDPPPARLDRQPQPRGAGAAARGVRAGRRAISEACSRPCSTAARRISRWSRATIRSRRGSRSWPSRRARGCSALTLLSGGEQALTAVALIFALFLTNPAPICVLDEVDAPLDDANVDRFCDLLDRMTARDRHALPDRHPQCGDHGADAPALRRDDDRARGQPPGLGRSRRRGDPARRRMISLIANDFQ